MANAANQFSQAASWIPIFEYLQQKTRALNMRILATGAVKQELECESLPLQFKYINAPDADWHREGLPVGYFLCDAVYDWPAGAAYWPARNAPGLGPLPELRIFCIEVFVRPESTETVPAVVNPNDRRTSVRLDEALISLVGNMSAEEKALIAVKAQPRRRVNQDPAWWRKTPRIRTGEARRDPGSDAFGGRRDKTINSLDKAIENSDLKPWLRLPDGTRVDLTQWDWRANAFRRDVIISGIWHDAAGGFPQYNGAEARVDRTAFEAWHRANTPEPEPVEFASTELAAAQPTPTEPTAPEIDPLRTGAAGRPTAVRMVETVTKSESIAPTPAAASHEQTKPKPIKQTAVRHRLGSKETKLVDLYTELKLSLDLTPSQVEKLAKHPFHKQWPKEPELCPDNRRSTARAYVRYVDSMKNRTS